MPYAEDKVKKYIESHLATFQTRVRVAQMLSLRCLTETARQQIAACEERKGNNLAFFEFFQQISAREGWVEQFIEALEENNASDLAREVRQVYEKHQLPSSGRKAAVSTTPCATENRSQLLGPSALNHNPSPPTEPALSPRENSPNSSEAWPPSPLSAGIPRSASSTMNPVALDLDDYNAPVQETQLPPQGSEMVVRRKVAPSARKPSSPPEKTTGSPRKAGGQKPADSQAPLATSLSLPAHPGELPAMEAKAPSTPEVSLRPEASSLTRQWDARLQPRAVCVANGCFGNRKSVAGSGASSALIGVPVAGTSGNQPEENCYFSEDTSPLGPNGQRERQEEQKTPALQRDWKEEMLNNLVGEDTSPLSLRRGFDYREQEGGLSPKENHGNVAVGGMVKGDPANRTPGNLRTGGDEDLCRHHLPASIAVELPPRAGELGTSFSDQSQVGSQPVSQVASPAAFQPPPSDFASTDVIPPNSPAGLSDAPSDFDSEVPKLPMQEKKLPFAEPSSTNPHRPMQENVFRPCLSAAVDQNTANRRRNRNDRVFHSNCDDDTLLKPGVLQSHPDELPGGLLVQHLSSPETTPEYSGKSDRLRFSLGSDSLQISNLRQSDRSGEMHLNPNGGAFPGRNGGHDASHQPSNGSHQDKESIRTFALCIREDASNGLTEADNVIGLGGLPNNKSPANFPSAGTGQQPDSQPKEKGWSPKPLTMFLLAGVALAVAFVLFKRKKP